MLIHDGWIKLHRKIIDHPFYGDPEFLSVWITLLLNATNVPINKNWNGKTITLKPGQLIASRKTMSFMTGVNQSKVYRVLKRLENEQQIEQQKSPRSTIITITNWEKYQSGEQLNEQLPNSYRTATGQEYKKGKYSTFGRGVLDREGICRSRQEDVQWINY